MYPVTLELTEILEKAELLEIPESPEKVESLAELPAFGGIGQNFPNPVHVCGIGAVFLFLIAHIDLPRQVRATFVTKGV